MKTTDPIKLLQEIEAWFCFNYNPDKNSIYKLRQDIKYCLSNIEQKPTDEDIHFAGKVRYNCDLVPDGESKRRIIDMANIWREGAKAHRDKLIPIKDK